MKVKAIEVTAKETQRKHTINIDDIVKVYDGKIGCACGCNGTYSSDQEMIGKVFAKVAKRELDALYVFDNNMLRQENTLSYWFELKTKTYMIEVKNNLTSTGTSFRID